FLVAILEGIQQSRQYTRATRANRMPERDRAAIHIHAVPVPLELIAVSQRLRRERFVRLDEIEIADRQAGLLHELSDGDDRSEEQLLRRNGASPVAGDARHD